MNFIKKLRPSTTREWFAIILAIAGLLFGFISNYLNNANQFRELTIAPSNYLPLLYAEPIAQPKLTLFYSEEQIENLYLIELRIENSGKRDISKDDLSRGIKVFLNESFRILEEEKLGNDFFAENTSFVYPNPNEIQIQLPMIKTKEGVSLRLWCELLDEQVPDINQLFIVDDLRVPNCNLNKLISAQHDESDLERGFYIDYPLIIIPIVALVSLAFLSITQMKQSKLAHGFVEHELSRIAAERDQWQNRFFGSLRDKQNIKSILHIVTSNNLKNTKLIAGKIDLENPEKYNVAVFLRVYDKWHNKPDNIDRTIDVSPIGEWSFDLYPWTDFMANCVRVDLISKDIDVPDLGKHGKVLIPGYTYIGSQQMDLIGLDKDEARALAPEGPIVS